MYIVVFSGRAYTRSPVNKLSESRETFRHNFNAKRSRAPIANQITHLSCCANNIEIVI